MSAKIRIWRNTAHRNAFEESKHPRDDSGKFGHGGSKKAPPGTFDKGIEKDKARAEKHIVHRTQRNWDKMQNLWLAGIDNYITQNKSGSWLLPESFGKSPLFKTKKAASAFADNLIMHRDLYEGKE